MLISPSLVRKQYFLWDKKIITLTVKPFMLHWMKIVFFLVCFSFSPLSLPPQFSVHLDISTTPPLTDVFVAQRGHISPNLEKIIVSLVQEILRLTLMAPQT